MITHYYATPVTFTDSAYRYFQSTYFQIGNINKYIITLNGILEILRVALRGERNNFWLFGPTGESEYGATDSIFCSFSIGVENCKANKQNTGFQYKKTFITFAMYIFLYVIEMYYIKKHISGKVQKKIKIFSFQ